MKWNYTVSATLTLVAGTLIQMLLPRGDPGATIVAAFVVVPGCAIADFVSWRKRRRSLERGLELRRH